MHTLHVDLSGPHALAENVQGHSVSYMLVAVLRIQSKDFKDSLLLPWAVSIATKTQGEVEDALRALIVEIEGTPLKGIPYGQRVLRMQSDRGTEWLNKTVSQLMKEKGILHTSTQGRDPQANGTAESYVGKLKSLSRRMLEASRLDEKYWPMAIEHAAQMLRKKALEPKTHIIPFGDKVVVRIISENSAWSPRGVTGQLLQHNVVTDHASYVLMDDGMIVKGTAPVQVTTLPWRQKNHGIEGPWQKVLSPEGKQFWLHNDTKETRWTTPFGVEVNVVEGDQQHHDESVARC
jgi:hypothetical protein